MTFLQMIVGNEPREPDVGSDHFLIRTHRKLYLPKEWADDRARRLKAGVPNDIALATKPKIALQHLGLLLAEGLSPYCVPADAGYGVDTAFANISGSGLGVHRLTRTRLLISTDFKHAVIKILVGRNNQIGRCWHTLKYPSSKIEL
jgi:hypothetical protein